MYPSLPCLKEYFETVEGISEGSILQQQLIFRQNAGATSNEITSATKEANNIAGFSGGALVSEMERLKSNLGLTGRHHINDLIKQACDQSLYGYSFQSELGRYLVGSDNGIRNGVAYRPGDNDNKLKLKSGVMPLFTLANSDNATCALGTSFDVNGKWYLYINKNAATTGYAFDCRNGSGLRGWGTLIGAGGGVRIILADSVGTIHDVTFTCTDISLNDSIFEFDIDYSAGEGVGAGSEGLKVKVKQVTAQGEDLETLFASQPYLVTSGVAAVDLDATEDTQSITQMKLGSSWADGAYYDGQIGYLGCPNGLEFPLSANFGDWYSTDHSEKFDVANPVSTSLHNGRSHLARFYEQEKGANYAMGSIVANDGFRITAEDVFDGGIGTLKFHCFTPMVTGAFQYLCERVNFILLRVTNGNKYEIKVGNSTQSVTSITFQEGDDVTVDWNDTLNTATLTVDHPDDTQETFNVLAFTSITATGTLHFFHQASSGNFMLQGLCGRITGYSSTGVLTFDYAGESSTECRLGTTIVSYQMRQVPNLVGTDNQDRFGNAPDQAGYMPTLSDTELDALWFADADLAAFTATVIADLDDKGDAVITSIGDEEKDSRKRRILLIDEDITDPSYPDTQEQAIYTYTNKP